jgi:hypothetical protein
VSWFAIIICRPYIEGFYVGNTRTGSKKSHVSFKGFLEIKFAFHPVSKAPTRETLVWELLRTPNLEFGMEAVGTYRVGTSANAALRYGALLLVKVASTN